MAKNADKGGEWKKQRELYKLMNALLRKQKQYLDETKGLMRFYETSNFVL